MSNGLDSSPRPRLCHILKWPDFQGYGFNLHAEKGKAGQFIGKVDEDSPATSAGLKSGDRIVEVNDVNIGNENHQQVVQRIKAGGEQTRLLVVDDETDQHYKDEKKVIRGDLPEVVHRRTQLRPGQEEPPSMPVTTTVETNQSVETIETTIIHPVDNNNIADEYQPRLCHIKKWPDFQGYGFNLHAERNKPGQYIGKVDEDSPAEKADLREHDRIIEVNGDNVEQEAHQNVIAKIRSGGDDTKLLVMDSKTDAYFKDKGIQVVGTMPQVLYIVTPSPPLQDIVEEVNIVEAEPVVETNVTPPIDDDIPEETTIPEVEVEQSFNISENVEVIPEPSFENTEPLFTNDDTPPVIDYDEHLYVNDERIDNDEPVIDHTINNDVAVTTNGTENETTVTETITTETVQVTETVPEIENGHPAPEVSIPEPEPEAPPAYSQVKISEAPTPVNNNTSNDRPEGMSAREYLEHLKNKKKADPRNQKVDFRTKYNMFEKM